MGKHLWGEGILALSLALVVAMDVDPVQAEKPASAKPSTKPARTADILTLLGEGKVATQLTAHGAYRLTVTLKNVSDEPLEVEFPPGLVADAFAQNQILYQLDGVIPLNLRTSSIKGSQGMGSLQSPKGMKIQPGAIQVLNLRTACMNLGAHEPKEGSWLFFKRVEDYTPDPRVHLALKQIAEKNLESSTAQAILWNLTDGLTFEQMAKTKMCGGGLFAPKTVLSAQSFLAKTLTEAAKEQETIAGTEAPTAGKPALFAFAVNPDPRGTGDVAPLVCQAVYKLKADRPRIAFSHANHPNPPPDLAKPYVQWGAIVQSQPATTQPGAMALLFTFARSEWDPKQKAWRYDLPTTSARTLEVASANGEALADLLMRELANRTIAVAPGRKKLAIANNLPVAVKTVTIGDAQNPRIKVKVAAEVAAAGQSEVTLTDEQVKQLTPAVTLVAAGFELQE